MNVWWLTTCDFDLNPLYHGILFRRNTGLSERNFARDGNVKFELEIKSRTLLWRTRSPLVHRVRLHLRGSSTQTAVKFFFMVTARAKGGSNFLAAQINQRNCEHDNYHPMARSSVNTPSSPSTQHGINHEKQFRTSRARSSRRRILDADDVPEIKSLYKQ